MIDRPLVKHEGGNGQIALSTEIISSLILKGDISGLNQTQRVEYVTKLCERIGLDPLTQPFKILKLQGKEVLYADKGCAQQLCKIYNISTEITKKEKIEDVYCVTVRAIMGERFTDEDGIVTIGTLKSDALANAMMKAVTKAKRRSVLALLGLGMLDETEIETIPGAATVEVTPPSVELIGDKELHEIRDQMIDLQTDEAKILGFMKVSKLEDIKLVDYPKLQKAFEIKREEKKKKETKKVEK